MLLGSFLFALFIQSSHGAYCHGKPNPNAASNDFAIYESDMSLLKEIENGALYMAGPESEGQSFYVAHVYGIPYDMGFALGTLLKQESIEFIDAVWNYLISEIPLSNEFPELANKSMEEALDLTAELTRPFTPDYWFEEMQGLADATGIPYETILRVHMLPSLTRGSCSMTGAWGPATPTGDLFQFRALDWDVDGPFKDFPAITVYHPVIGHPFANIGMVSFIGSVTGISSSRQAICEIGVSYPDSTFGRESRAGYPFIFVLRDILQFDNTVDQSTDRMESIRRTCDLILGVGNGNEKKFRGYEYSYETLNVMDDQNMMPYNETWHPRIDSVVYWGMDWNCPGYSQVLSEQIMDFYGNITAENAIHNMIAHTQTGNLHVAVYDYVNDRVLVSFHSKSSDDTSYKNAYERPYVSIQLKELFLEN